MTGSVHKVEDYSDWPDEKTACGVVADSVPDEDVVLPAGKHPVEYGHGRKPCPVCYPHGDH